MFPKPQLITLPILILFTFFLRIPTFFEPAWYGDELIRLVVAREWFSGKILYSQVFDNSPPLLYLIFGLARDLLWLKITAAVWVTAAVVVFYFLVAKLSKDFQLGKIYPILAVILFVLLTSTPIFEGNIATAEIFVLAPVICAMFLIFELVKKYQANEARIDSAKVNGGTKFFLAFLAGILFAAASLVRIQVVTDLTAAILFLIMFKNFKPAFNVLLSFFIIWFATFAFFSLQQNFQSFSASVFLGNFDYVNFANKLIVPFGLLILKLTVAFTAFIVLLKFRKFFTKFEIFVIVWLIFAAFGTAIGGRGYPHYFLQITPAAALLLAMVVGKRLGDFAKIATFLVIFAIFFVLGQFYLPRFFSYYKNFFNNFTNLEVYKNWFGMRVTQSETIASYILAKTAADDKILVLGDAPEIYYLSERSPAGIYLVSYHLNFQREARSKMLADFIQTPPKIAVVFPEGEEVVAEIIPILTKTYKPVFKIGQGQIWERQF